MERLAELRKRAGMTQSQLAYATDLAHSGISQYERGVKIPTASSLRRLADVLSEAVGLPVGVVLNELTWEYSPQRGPQPRK